MNATRSTLLIAALSLGPPPPGQKYVRIAVDILLIAVGTRIVIDAMSDLSRI